MNYKKNFIQKNNNNNSSIKNAGSYIMNNNINKTLLILSPTFIREASTSQGLES